MFGFELQPDPLLAYVSLALLAFIVGFEVYFCWPTKKR